MFLPFLSSRPLNWKAKVSPHRSPETSIVDRYSEILHYGDRNNSAYKGSIRSEKRRCIEINIFFLPRSLGFTTVFIFRTFFLKASAWISSRTIRIKDEPPHGLSFSHLHCGAITVSHKNAYFTVSIEVDRAFDHCVRKRSKANSPPPLSSI